MAFDFYQEIHRTQRFFQKLQQVETVSVSAWIYGKYAYLENVLYRAFYNKQDTDSKQK